MCGIYHLKNYYYDNVAELNLCIWLYYLDCKCGQYIMGNYKSVLLILQYFKCSANDVACIGYICYLD